jgi:1-phosphofructokinase family hexose kinase
LIFTVTLNPAVDKILFLEEFHRSRTTRLSRTMETIGGKGTHVSINLKLQNVQSTALGIALGESGRKITRMLKGWGVEVSFLQYDRQGMESRTNYEIVEQKGHVCTMLTERGPILPRGMTDDLLRQIKDLVGKGDILVLTGDASNVEDIAIYSKLTQAAREIGARVVLDASGHYLQEGIRSNPYLIKPNLEELSFIANHDLITEQDIILAMKSLDEFAIPIIAMTWAGKGAIIKMEDAFYRIRPLAVATVNEGGCGDAFLSALIVGMVTNEPIESTLKRAAAVSAAAAESEITAGFDPARAEELFTRAKVERIDLGASSREERTH